MNLPDYDAPYLRYVMRYIITTDERVLRYRQRLDKL